MRLLATFDSWVERGTFTRNDVGRYRILYAILVILVGPQVRWLAGYPPSFFRAPPGPFRILNAFPPIQVLTLLEIAQYVFLAAVLAGFFTMFASFGAAILLAVNYGLEFSAGKVDHSFLMCLVPAIMAFGHWGDTCSIDALRSRRRAVPDAGVTPAQRQWPFRLLAVSIGLAFVTAALPKLLGGWLNPTTQAAYAYQVRSLYGAGRGGWLASVVLGLHAPILWESLDWMTLLVEGTVVLCVLSWRWWRISLSVLTLFHLAIGLTLVIFFDTNVIAYAAFVSWGVVALPKISLSERLAGVLRRFAVVWILILGCLAWWTANAVSDQVERIKSVIIICGAALGAGYLVGQLRLLLAYLGSRPSHTQPEHRQ